MGSEVFPDPSLMATAPFAVNHLPVPLLIPQFPSITPDFFVISPHVPSLLGTSILPFGLVFQSHNLQ
jgi:hypothetical protein